VKTRRRLKLAVAIVLAAVILISCAGFIVVHALYSRQFARTETPESSIYPSYDEITGYDRYPVSFKSGENTLRGNVYGAENDGGLVVIVHGLGGGSDNYIMEMMWFVDHGRSVLTYDATGSFSSDGDGKVSLAQAALDLDAALTFIEGDERLRERPVLLFGHSWGGYAVTAVLNFDHDVTASVCMAGYDLPFDLLFEQSRNIIGGLAYALYPFERVYHRIVVGKTERLSAVEGINRSGIPVLIVNGDRDDVVRADGSGLASHRGEITNPNVEYLEVKNRGHNDLLLSDAALALEGVPGADRFAACELDDGLMTTIDGFFATALK
jgi:pimeloyl-ACP methyl ester carboxylesterase